MEIACAETSSMDFVILKGFCSVLFGIDCEVHCYVDWSFQFRKNGLWYGLLNRNITTWCLKTELRPSLFSLLVFSRCINFTCIFTTFILYFHSAYVVFILFHFTLIY